MASPPNLRPPTPGTDEPPVPPSPKPELRRAGSSFGSLMSLSKFDRYGDDWSEAWTLVDIAETFFDSRLDLINRRLKAQSARLKNRAVELLPKGLRTPGGGGRILLMESDSEDEAGNQLRRRKRAVSGDKYRREVEKEVERIKVKLAAEVTNLSTQWHSAQIVRGRDKVSFTFGVMSLVFTCLMYGLDPEWIPAAYTIQTAFYLPLRAVTYKRKKWHYFLFGHMCYFINALDLIWMWIFPSSTVLFIATYLLTMGPLASAIITWRNSLVFHSLDKVTSLFIHMYPPLTLTVILHKLKDHETKYPGLVGLGQYAWWQKMLWAGVPYIMWQAAYYKFISVDRKSKIESGERENSFHFMVNDKRGPIGRALSRFAPTSREPIFIFGQLIYSIITMIPGAALFIHSPKASSAYLILIFTVSAWNGATYYVEVFGRKFERELEKLRKELETASATGSTPSGPTPSSPGTPNSRPQFTEKKDKLDSSPLVLPSTGHHDDAAEDLKVPELVLDKAAEESEHAKEKEDIAEKARTKSEPALGPVV